MTPLIINNGDIVEVRVFARGVTPSKHDRWHRMKVRGIVCEGKTNIVREAYVSGPVDGTERGAWVQARYIRMPMAAAPSDTPDISAASNLGDISQ